MATLLPSDVTALSLSLGETAELRTLEFLRRSLPDDYIVFHSVHWSLATAARAMYGEADFVVVNRAGEAVVVEQKAGALEETGEGLAKRYPGAAPKLVAPRIHRTLDALRKRFHQQTGGTLALDHLLYCPDHRVHDPLGAGLAADRIVDAPDAARLPERIVALIGPGQATKDGERVRRFFANEYHLVPDIHAHVREGGRAMARLSGGFADAVEAIEMAPLRLRVRGTAGCGKSTVALRFAERATAAGKRVSLVCFNRPLAEKLKAAAPEGAFAATFHGFLDAFLKARGHELDYGRFHAPGFWQDVQEQVIAETIPPDWCFDALVVDEGQDFEADWYDVLRLFLNEGADILWLEDSDQAIRRGLGDREALEARLAVEGFIGYRTRANYRSPETIADHIRERLPDFEFEALNPLPGLGVGEYTVAGPEEQGRKVGAIVTDLVRRGFRHEDIVVLSMRGVDNATLTHVPSVGSFTLARPTGTYDGLGNQIHEPGQIRFDTIHRFKGQEAPAVILTDVGPPPDDPERRARADRTLFAAMTRATVRLDIVTTA